MVSKRKVSALLRNQINQFTFLTELSKFTPFRTGFMFTAFYFRNFRGTLALFHSCSRIVSKIYMSFYMNLF